VCGGDFGDWRFGDFTRILETIGQNRNSVVHFNPSHSFSLSNNNVRTRIRLLKRDRSKLALNLIDQVDSSGKVRVTYSFPPGEIKVLRLGGGHSWTGVKRESGINFLTGKCMFPPVVVLD